MKNLVGEQPNFVVCQTAYGMDRYIRKDLEISNIYILSDVIPKGIYARVRERSAKNIKNRRFHRLKHAIFKSFWIQVHLKLAKNHCFVSVKIAVFDTF